MALLIDAEEAEIERARLENGYRPSRNAHQKRFDRMTRRLCAAREENRELRAGLERALLVIDKLRSRNKWQTNNSR
jgi:hypothetical protein